MTSYRASFLSHLCFGVCFVLLPCVVEAIMKDACPEEAKIISSPRGRRDKPRLISMRNLTLEFDDFPRDLKWFANGSTYGCVCDVFTCLRLCCPRGAVRENATCIPTAGDFLDQWPDIYFRNLTLKPSGDFLPIVGYPCEIGGYPLNLSAPAGSENEFHLLDEGLLIHIAIDDSVTDRYCLVPQSTTYVLVMCHSPDSNPYDVQSLAPVAGYLLSIPFLLVTFIVYVLLPELNTIHGLTLRCYVASLGFSLIFLGTDRLASFEDSIWLCRFIGLGIYFSISASFAWLNVMCIDIWRTFGFRSTILVIDSEQKCRKFRFYSIYAWGIASIFSGVCIIMELVPGLSEDLIRPEIASNDRCWFATREAELAYFYGPITVILICNTFMFVATVMEMIWHQRTVAPLLSSDQNSHHEAKKWLIVYSRLFIIMGINWMTEVMSWWWAKENVKYLWYIMDTVNALQGLTIFLILVCKKEIIRSLKKRFKEIRRSLKDNELSLDSSSMNAPQRTRNNTLNCQTTEFNDPSTSESILSSNSHSCSSLMNTVGARDYQ